MTAVVVALAAAVLVLAVLVAGLLRSHAEILRALHELGAGLELDRAGEGGPQPLVLEPFAPVRPAADPPGTEVTVPPMPQGSTARPTSVAGSTLDDEVVALPLQGAGDTLLAFLSSGCSTCQGFWDAFASRVDVPGGARLVVVAQDLDEESESALRSRAPGGVPLLLSSEAWAQFEVPGSPYFVHVDGETGRVVGEGSAAGWPQVVDLLGQALADHRARGERRSRIPGTRPPGSIRVSGSAHRRERDDAALLSAGIRPGDPSLWTADGADEDRLT